MSRPWCFQQGLSEASFMVAKAVFGKKQDPKQAKMLGFG